ncbi:hypothetical protein ACRAWG_12205 [Methylobacterium sp. P31]
MAQRSERAVVVGAGLAALRGAVPALRRRDRPAERRRDPRAGFSLRTPHG